MTRRDGWPELSRTEGNYRRGGAARLAFGVLNVPRMPVADNLLTRRFDAAVPNPRWAGDTTELHIGESGRLFLAVTIDLFSRFAIGWTLSAVNDRHLTIKALEMAVGFHACPPSSGTRPPARWRTSTDQQVLHSPEDRIGQPPLTALIGSGGRPGVRKIRSGRPHPERRPHREGSRWTGVIAPVPAPNL